MKLGLQTSTNTKEVAALMAVGVDLLGKEELDKGDPVTRLYTEVNPYDAKKPEGGGELCWLLKTVSATGHKTGMLRHAWNESEAADRELDEYVDSLPDEYKRRLKALIPPAQMAAIRCGMYNWTALADAAKKARKMISFRNGRRHVVIPWDYTQAMAEKFNLAYPNPQARKEVVR